MQLVRSSISSVIYYGSRLSGKKKTGTRILCYHHIGNHRDDYLTVLTNHFREQMDYLKRNGYETISLSDLIRGNVTDRSIVITFDDGYEDNFLNAFPILKERNFKATIFCVVHEIGTLGYLNKDQIHTMVQAGFEFGSHTLTHAELPALSREDKLKEIAGSRTKLEKELNLKIQHFCYPRGLYDAETVDLVEQAGYLAACSNEIGSNNGIMNPYLLKRTEIANDDSLFDFKKKLSGAYDFLHRVLHQLRGRP